MREEFCYLLMRDLFFFLLLACFHLVAHRVGRTMSSVIYHSSHKMFAFEVVFRSVFTQEKKLSGKNEKLCEKSLLCARQNGYTEIGKRA
jgi:hypothetical protein